MVEIQFVNTVQEKYEQACALIRAVAPEWVGYPKSEIYQQLEQLGWYWRGDGWYARFEVREA